MKIDLNLAKKLITEQFPKYANLPIKNVKFSGIDNRTFRLGDDLLIRLPSAAGYAAQVAKEQQWLPKLATSLSYQIPEPLHMGVPSKEYPWNWSIYKWLPGVSANQLELKDEQLENIAIQLSEFIQELHNVDIIGAPLGGLHNYYRGCHVSVYDKNARSDIEKLKDIIDVNKALVVWNRALDSKWSKDPVWVHGDVASGNILVQNKSIAVIDFGCTGIGDPACDLVIAWTFFKGRARELFKKKVNMDEDTWNRARGWALWKASFQLVTIKDKDSLEAKTEMDIINSILAEV